MPYPQDLVGKYIDYMIDVGYNITDNMRNNLVNGVLPNQTTPLAPVAVYDPQPANVQQGAFPGINHNVHNPTWNFTFLKWVGGAVTTIPLNNPVLTGPMSGCYLCTYTQRGQNLAHIGTSDRENLSVEAKTAWLNFVTRPDVTMVKGGSPSDYFFNDEHRAAQFRGCDTKVFGYFAARLAYAILLAPVPLNLNPLGKKLLKVASVKPMTMQQWASIMAMRRFQL